MTEMDQRREVFAALVQPHLPTMWRCIRRRVSLALDDLSPEFRMTVLLADMEGYAYKEISDIMGCPIGTVMSRLSRARHLLRTTLQAVLEE